MDITPSYNLADFPCGAARTNCLDDTNTFMAERNPRFAEVTVGTAKTRVRDSNQDFIGAQRALCRSLNDLAVVFAFEYGELLGCGHC